MWNFPNTGPFLDQMEPRVIKVSNKYFIRNCKIMLRLTILPPTHSMVPVVEFIIKDLESKCV